MRSRSVFLAYPVSAVTGPSWVDAWADVVDASFTQAGWSVCPSRHDRCCRASLRDEAVDDALLARNVQNIVESDIVTLLAADAMEPSSIWVEFGVAIAARVPVVLVRSPDRHLPFLADLARTSGPSAPCRFAEVTFDLSRPPVGTSGGLGRRLVKVAEQLLSG